ncbi:MAG: hypothetical protein ABWJ42_03570 [Sulfolobales archaeon]
MRVLVSWSSGKDSALAFYMVKHVLKLDVRGFITTIDLSTNTVSGHGISLHILREQIRRIREPLYEIGLPKDLPPTRIYEEIMIRELSRLKELLKVEGVVFGDIHIEDMIEFKRKLLAKIDLEAVFPLISMSSAEVVNRFIDLGFKALVVAVDSSKLDRSYICRELNHDLVRSLPRDVDIAGEYGEYHTLVFDGPIFEKPLELVVRGVRESENKKILCDLDVEKR